MRSPRSLIALGVVLMLLGIIIPFLMVVRILPTGLALSFFSAGASVAGMALGMIGVAYYVCAGGSKITGGSLPEPADRTWWQEGNGPGIMPSEQGGIQN